MNLSKPDTSGRIVFPPLFLLVNIEMYLAFDKHSGLINK